MKEPTHIHHINIYVIQSIFDTIFIAEYFCVFIIIMS